MLDANAIRSRSAGPVDHLDPTQHDWRHVELRAAVPHPWFEDQLARALGISPNALARCEPQGWREQAVSGFDVGATLTALRNDPSADPARIDLLDRMLEAEVSPRDWLLRALPIPPADQRASLERRYANVLAGNAELEAAWTPERERSLARALARLFDPRRFAERLRIEARAPEAISGSVVPDPDLSFEQIGIPDALARSLGVTNDADLLVLVRPAPSCDAVVSLRALLIPADDHVLRVSPLLLCVLSRRAGVDACELELVVGRGRGRLAQLGPVHTLFARPSDYGSLLPHHVQAIIDRVDRVDPTQPADRKRHRWSADPELRRARLLEAEQRLLECLDPLTASGLSLGFEDLSEPARAIALRWIPYRVEIKHIWAQYADGLILSSERDAKFVDVRSAWRDECARDLRERSNRLDLWLTRWDASCLLVGVPTDLDAPALDPQTLIAGVDPHKYHLLARHQRRFRVDVALAVDATAETTRMSIAALRDGPRATVADCGLAERASAVEAIVNDGWQDPWRPAQPLQLPQSVLTCHAAWVCERCWSEAAGDQRVHLTTERAGLELARFFLEPNLWDEHRGHHRPLKHMPLRRRRWWELVADRDQFEIHGLAWDHDAYAEITTAAGVDRVPLPFGARVKLPNQFEARVVAGTTTDPFLIIDSCTRVEWLGTESLQFCDRDGRLHRIELRWPWSATVHEYSSGLRIGLHYGISLDDWSDCYHRFERNDWRVLLRRGLGPVEELSPIAGRLRIDRLADGVFDLHVDSPTRTWTQRRTWLNPEIMWAADGDPIQAGQRLVGGHLDISARAAIEPESTREWLLELLTSLLQAGRAHVDWRALELYAKLATTPRDRYRTLTELACDPADPLTRMRLGSLFEELRVAVLSPAAALRDPTSLAIAAQICSNTHDCGSPMS